MALAKVRCSIGSTGLCTTLVLAGCWVKQLPSFQLICGLTGLGVKPPPQFGQTLNKISSTQSRQKVHSKVQIMASVDSGGSDLLQCSQVGLSSSISIHDSFFVNPMHIL